MSRGSRPQVDTPWFFRAHSLRLSSNARSWLQNVMRHSFGSYFYAKTKNENLTAAEMGNSPAMVFRHYPALVRAEEVVTWWQIMPQ